MICILKRGQGFTKYNPNLNYPLTYIPSDYDRYHAPFEEIFVHITDKSVPGVMPWYLISNFGRVFHRFMNDFLSINVDSKGYSYKPLVTRTGKQVNVRIHRVIMLEFAYIPGCENLLVNHKDGNKLNNLITNLEWCTYSENTLHSYNVLNNGRVHSCKYSDEELLHSICRDLQEGKLTALEIGNKYNVPRELIEAILYRRAHKEISKNYIFAARKNAFDDQTIHQICSYMENIYNPIKPSISNDLCRDILRYIGFSNDEITCNSIEVIRRIYLRKSFKSISNNYNW